MSFLLFADLQNLLMGMLIYLLCASVIANLVYNILRKDIKILTRLYFISCNDILYYDPFKTVKMLEAKFNIKR